jgi:hypothetical protein
LKERGFKGDRSMTERYWEGLGLRSGAADL